MAPPQRTVWEVAEQAVANRLNIPELQREFIWDPEQVKLLAKSLYRDYPAGSFLLWNSSTYQEPQAAEGAGSPLWIVDGQQRTRALCLMLDQEALLVDPEVLE